MSILNSRRRSFSKREEFLIIIHIIIIHNENVTCAKFGLRVLKNMCLKIESTYKRHENKNTLKILKLKNNSSLFKLRSNVTLFNKRMKTDHSIREQQRHFVYK